VRLQEFKQFLNMDSEKSKQSKNNLDNMKNIYSLLCVLMSSAAILAGCQEVVEIEPLPEEEASPAKTGPATVDETEVTLEGSYVYDGTDAVSAGFRCAKTQTELAVAQTKPAVMAGEDSFYLVMPDVDNGEYWYQSVVEAGGETWYGKAGFFKVDFNSVPSVTTLVAEITDDSYILKGSYVFESKKISIVPGFFYAASEEELETAKFVAADMDGKKFSYRVPLSFGSRCYFQAAACVKEEYYRGSVMSAGMTDLSAEGPANCFVVSQPGLYVFDAVKADGSAVEGDTADWVWSTGTGTILSDIKYNNGKIMFSAGDQKGSEVIALVKDGVIQWSWHVWITDVRDQSYDGITMMDRNLGALSDNAATADAIGLMYQWGRKDPFIGTNVMDKTIPVNLYESKPFGLEPAERVWTAPYVCNKDVVPSGFKHDGAKLTESLAKQNPTVHYGGYGSGGWKYDNAEIQDYWGGVSLTNTVNNPCPAGYRVPTHDEMVKYINGIVDNGGTTAEYPDYAKTWGKRFILNGETYNIPATGWRAWSGIIARPGNVVAMSTASLCPDGTKSAISIYWDFNKKPGKNWTVEAFPVRCMRIK